MSKNNLNYSGSKAPRKTSAKTVSTKTVSTKTINFNNSGVLVYDKDRPVFIKQPTIKELSTLYKVIMSNIQNIREVFNNPHEYLEDELSD